MSPGDDNQPLLAKIPSHPELQSYTEPNATEWEDDRRNPMNFSTARKLAIIGLASFASFNECVTTTILTPEAPKIVEEFQFSSPSLTSFLISAHIIGFVFGPLIVAPMTELFGRAPLLHGSNTLSTFASLISAVSPNIGVLLVGRVLMGLAGSVPSIIGGSLIADLIPVQMRGSYLSVWACGPLLGTVVGPIVGGYISLGIGWRWALRMESVLCGLSTIAGVFMLQETQARKVIRKIKAQSSHYRGDNYLVCQDNEDGDLWAEIKGAVTHSIILQTTSPVVIIVSLYTSTAFVLMYFLITTSPVLFGEGYGFDEAQIGLTYIGQGVGFAMARFIGPILDWYIKRQEARYGYSRPRDRLPPIVPGNTLIAIGLLWYGWSAEARLHWIMPIVGSGIVALGISVVFTAAQSYLIDAFTAHAASVIAANVTVRSIFGVVMPLFGPPLYAHFGFGWGNTILALIALGLTPTVLILYHYEKLWKAFNPQREPSWTHPNEINDK